MRSIEIPSVKGSIIANPGKSFAIRAIAIAMRCLKPCKIINPGTCDDTGSAISMAKALGAKVLAESGSIVIHHNPHAILANPIYLPPTESALAFRIFAIYAAFMKQDIILQAKASLVRRNHDLLFEALDAMQVKHSYDVQKGTIRISGMSKVKQLKLDGSGGSQVCSAVLLANAINQYGFELEIRNLKSKPYLDMTIEILQSFGIKVFRKGYESFYIEPSQEFRAQEVCVEGDYSGAAFVAVMAALGGEVRISGLRKDSSQADIAIVKVLQSVGAEVKHDQDTLFVRKQALNAFSFNANECPDLIPPLVALASGCDGISSIQGAKRLINKECNRAEALIEEFGKLGIEIHHKDDILLVTGGESEPAIVRSHGDHRIAMSLAIMAARGHCIRLEDGEVVKKSYPGFYDDLISLGGKIE